MEEIKKKCYCVTGEALTANGVAIFSPIVEVDDCGVESSNKDEAIGKWLDYCNEHGRYKGTIYRVISIEEMN